MKIVKALFQNPRTILLMVFLAVFSFGQLQRVQLPNNMAFYIHDVLIVMFLLWQFITDKKIRSLLRKIPSIFQQIKKDRPLELALGLWIIGGMIAGTFAGAVILKSWLYLARLVIYLLFVITVVKTKPKTYLMPTGLAITGTLIGVWGIIQYALIPDTRFLHIFGWDNHYYRLISTLLDPAFTGMLLVLTIGWWQFPKVFPRLPLIFKQISQAVLVVAIAATFSRASYLALWAFLLLQFVGRKIKMTFLIAMIVIFAASLVMLPKPGGEGVNLARTSTGEARLGNAWQNLLVLHGNQWLWGRGLFNSATSVQYKTPDHAQLPDSLPILVLNATGVGGTLLALLVIFKWLPYWRRQNSVWTNLLIAVLIHSLFNNTFLQPFIFLGLWLSL